jgi:hypothetical protein
MKTIVRIEHISVEGIFHSASVNRLSNISEFCDRHARFPTPNRENPKLDMGLKGKEWFCAFKSIEQMNEWVTPIEIKELLGLGCKVLVLDVTEYQEGEYQIIFTKDSIKNSKDISDLFK